jgi:AraC family transcriptional regulator, regulatory protein of adaptative response / methylated-DNA-[protein]-cysteine methyltransferase
MLMVSEQSVPQRARTSATLYDYDRVRRAVAFVSGKRLEQPSLDEIAAHVGLSPAHFHRLFRRWAGVSPKLFLQALTLDHAKRLLRGSASVLDTAYEVGLSGESRLHDLFVAHEAMTPGAYKRAGEGLEIVYGFHPSPFGLALVMASPLGLTGLAFADGENDRAHVLAEMQARWPLARYVHDPARTARYVQAVFGAPAGHANVDVVLIGSDFEIRVWRALLKVPTGHAVTYGDVAQHIGCPAAARAVGRAVGRNPLAFVVPCHRVIGASGALTGYHWGLTRKRVLLGWEAARLTSAK